MDPSHGQERGKLITKSNRNGAESSLIRHGKWNGRKIQEAATVWDLFKEYKHHSAEDRGRHGCRSPSKHYYYLAHQSLSWSTWVAQLVKHLALAQVMIPGSWDGAPSWAPCSVGTLLLPPLALPWPMLGLSLCQIIFLKCLMHFPSQIMLIIAVAAANTCWVLSM